MHIVGVRCIAHEKIELEHMLARLLTSCTTKHDQPRSMPLLKCRVSNMGMLHILKDHWN